IGVMVNDYLEAMNYSVTHKSSDQETSYTEYFKNLLPLETKGDNNVYVRLYIYKDKMTANISRVYIKVVNTTKGDQEIFHSEINKIGDALFEMISARIGDQNVKIKKSNFAELGP
ncbi:MAG: hypothetical protein MUF59_10375, partial [Candidatus Krumholzibacteria bacterium]|nr:hypothetical protein [Candidatus Krumholzibacteria bacterium]